MSSVDIICKDKAVIIYYYYIYYYFTIMECKIMREARSQASITGAQLCANSGIYGE